MKLKPISAVLMFAMIIVSSYAAVTNEQAEDSISLAKRGIAEMQSAGLNITSANIALAVAMNVFENAPNKTLDGMAETCQEFPSETDREYCLNQETYLQEMKTRLNSSEAISEAYYTIVTQFGDRLEMRKDEAFLSLDKIRATELKIQDYGMLWVDTKEASELLVQAEEALQQENYEFARALTQQADNYLEANRTELTIARVYLQNIKKFLIQHMTLIITILVIILITSGILLYPARRILLRRRVNLLGEELTSLDTLMKQAQHERFRTGELSEGTYNVRMDVYKKRLEKARTRLPIEKEKLRRTEEFLSKFKRNDGNQ